MNIRYCLIALAVGSLGACTTLEDGSVLLTADEPRTAAASGSATGTASTASTSTSTASTTASTAANTSAAATSSFVAIEDDPLIVDTGSIFDDDGLGVVTVQWQISGNGSDWANLPGAAQQSFTPRETHVGKRVRVVITYVDGQGNLETLESPASNPVENVNDTPTGAPVLTGVAMEGDALMVDTSSIDDEDGVGTLELIWQRSSGDADWRAYPEATGEILRLDQEHVGYAFRAVVAYVDSHDTREVLTSNPSEVVVNVDDPVQGEVALSGDPIEGGYMTVDTTGLSDEDGIASLLISWEFSDDGRNWRTVDTPVSNRLDLDQDLVGKQVRARASLVDVFGVETLIYSRTSNTVQNVNDAPTGRISVRRLGS